MASNQALASVSSQSILFNLFRVLSTPWLDRTIAAIACVPLVYLAYYRYEHWHHGFPLLAAALNVLILVATMVIRRPPKRITPNPWYWLLAFVATYWQILVLGLLQPGRAIAANWITDTIATVGILIVIWARLSLGRNIGFVPAQRELVDCGAYAYMRHPVYTRHPSYERGFSAACLQPPERAAAGTWRVLVHSSQKPCRGGLLACRSAICRIHAEGPGSLDPVSDLKSNRQRSMAA